MTGEPGGRPTRPGKRPARQDPPGPPEPADREAEFDAWLTRLVERTDPVMAWLGVLFALFVGLELAVRLRPPVATAVATAIWVIWVVFAVDFLAKLLLAPIKIRFLRKHWLQALGLLLPTLRVLSFLRLVRVGRAFPVARVVATSYRSAGTARRLLGSRLGYLAGLATVITVMLAELAFLFENRPGGTLHSFPDALVWAASVVIGMQADPVPTGRPGQILMLAGFATGLVLIATLAGSLGAFLLEGTRERLPGTDERDAA